MTSLEISIGRFLYTLLSLLYRCIQYTILFIILFFRFRRVFHGRSWSFCFFAFIFSFLLFIFVIFHFILSSSLFNIVSEPRWSVISDRAHCWGRELFERFCSIGLIAIWKANRSIFFCQCNGKDNSIKNSSLFFDIRIGGRLTAARSNKQIPIHTYCLKRA